MHARCLMKCLKEKLIFPSNFYRIASSLDLCPKLIGTDHPVSVSIDFCLREGCRIASSLDLCPKLIGTDHPVIESVYFCLQEGCRITSSLYLFPKLIGIDHPVSGSGLHHPWTYVLK